MAIRAGGLKDPDAPRLGLREAYGAAGKKAPDRIALKTVSGKEGTAAPARYY